MNVAELSGFFFLDTNILVYSFDDSAPAKQATAREIIQGALETQRGIISTQVVQEFLNVSTRKFSRPLNRDEARAYTHAVLMPLCRHYPSIAFYERALDVQAETGYSFYDALIVTAAIAGGCQTLLSEDMQDGRSVQGLQIINPFSE